MGTFLLAAPVLSTRAENRSTTQSLFIAAGFASLASYNFFQLTDDGVTSGRFWKDNFIGYAALFGYVYGVSLFFP